VNFISCDDVGRRRASTCDGVRRWACAAASSPATDPLSIDRAADERLQFCGGLAVNAEQSFYRPSSTSLYVAASRARCCSRPTSGRGPRRHRYAPVVATVSGGITPRLRCCSPHALRIGQPLCGATAAARRCARRRRGRSRRSRHRLSGAAVERFRVRAAGAPTRVAASSTAVASRPTRGAIDLATSAARELDPTATYSFRLARVGIEGTVRRHE